ncbi:hypothetical protein Aros01_04906 [Streptosporangium roseum]|uniref:Uncharacterized protein n=1 Tax=Streptosporangium roseum (strain ATCC 12428 / DSM 43021 / JCM 3005 / KCTC 9067 / NCIMB 10171 / NRRL 2505 / NI 9100) TaxID=479432 RepID=D2AYH1_STRRD|nr:hypothetical protein Sros_6226 [Streptosporangium roseum DSM 43021]
MVKSSQEAAFPLFKAVTPDRRMRMAGRLSPRSDQLPPAEAVHATRTPERRASHE